MKWNKYFFVIILALLASCRGIKQNTEMREQSDQDKRSFEVERIIERVTDTLVMRTLPKEFSKSFGKDTVRVETQYSFARGWISWVSDSTYLIVVEIENKVSAILTERIIYKDVFKEKTDTLYLSQKKESKSTEVVIKNDNAFMRYIIACGWILQGLILVLLIWGVYKVYSFFSLKIG